MKEIINEIAEILAKIVITTLEPLFLSVTDIFKNVLDVERNIIQNAVEVESEIIKNIVNIINDREIIEDASKFYYLILLAMDIVLISSIFKGEIRCIPMEDLIIYIILFIVIVLSVLNLLLKHSKFNNRIKLFSIVQVLIIIPIVIAYWIVSIEGDTFDLKKLDVNQWSSIFNNIIIYFATCIIGMSVHIKVFGIKMMIKN